jgi:hypothetical protein
MLNVTVKQKRLASNPCGAVEFPIRINHTIRKPHYMTSTEQQKIEFCAPSHLRNVVVIISKMGLRPYKELMPMKKEQVDLENLEAHIPDSKTPSGIGDMPVTKLAARAFQAQMKASPHSALPPLPPASHLRQPAQCRRGLGPFRHSHVAAGRRPSLQTLQSSQAQHETGSSH